MTDSVSLLTEDDFKRLGQAANAVFAWRAAMRILPLLGGTPRGLEFWPEPDRAEYLAVVLAALDVASLQFYGRMSVVGLVVTVPASEASIASEAASEVAAASVAAAASAAACFAAFSTTGADFAFDAAAASASASGATNASMCWDFERLLSWQASSKNGKAATPPLEMVFAPLWQNADESMAESMLSSQHKLVEDWCKVMMLYGHQAFANNYRELLRGGGWNVEASGQRYEIWYEGYLRDRHKLAKPGIETVAVPAADEINTMQSGGVAIALADASVAQDHLGRTPLVNTLANMLASPQQTLPMTIALLGDWGAGKSSVIDQIKKRLDAVLKEFDQAWTLVSERDRNQPYRYIHAHFNAWEYEKTENIHAGLAQEVVNGLIAKMSFGQKLKFSFLNAWCQHRWQFVWSLLGLGGAALAVACVAGSGDLGLNPFSEAFLGVGAAAAASFILYRSWKTASNILEHPLVNKLQTYLKLPSYGEHLGLVPVIKQQIETLCRLCLKGLYRHRLLVVVDDLDRCSPKCITDTLDAIRLVMNLDNVVVLIAIDDRVAFRAVAEHYKELSDHDRPAAAIARDYLGKIIQLPVNLPKPSAADLNGFIDGRLFHSLALGGALESSARDVKGEQMGGEPKIDLLGNAVEELADDSVGLSEPLVDMKQELKRAVSRRSVTEMQSLMVDCQEEREQFKQLVVDMGFYNPRQLIRLKNSYRVLKGVSDLSARENNLHEYRGLMLALFWAEFLFQFPLENKEQPERGRRHLELEMVDLISGAGSDDDAIMTVICAHFIDWLGERSDVDEKLECYFDLMQSVSVVVLSSAEGGLLLSREKIERCRKKRASVV